MVFVCTDSGHARQCRTVVACWGRNSLIKRCRVAHSTGVQTRSGGHIVHLRLVTVSNPLGHCKLLLCTHPQESVEERALKKTGRFACGDDERRHAIPAHASRASEPWNSPQIPVTFTRRNLQCRKGDTLQLCLQQQPVTHQDNLSIRCTFTAQVWLAGLP